MSEAATLDYETASTEGAPRRINQAEQSGDQGPETVDEWVRPLYNFVIANATEVRKWSWMGGAEAPLSASMWKHPGVTPDNLPDVIADISASLANRDETKEKPEKKETKEVEDGENDNIVVEDEAPLGREEIQENRAAELKTQKAKQQSDPSPLRQETAATEQPEAPGAKSIGETANEATMPDYADTSAEQPVSVVAGSEDKGSDNTASDKKTDFAPQARSKAGDNNRPKGALKSNKPGAGHTTQTDKKETDSQPVHTKSDIESVTKKETAALREKTPVGTTGLDVVSGVKAEPRHFTDMPVQDTELSSSETVGAEIEIEDIALPAETEKLAAADIGDEIVTGEEMSLAEEEAEPNAGYQTGRGGLIDFAEGEEVLIVHEEDETAVADAAVMGPAAHEEGRDDVEVPTLSLIDSEAPIGQEESVESEQADDISLRIEDIEESLTLLAGLITDRQPEEAEKINEILAEITNVPVQYEFQEGEDISAEAQEQELIRLFTELFEEAGIDYTPELVGGLARLTVKWQQADKTNGQQAEKDLGQGTRQGSGTHEIINILLAGVSDIKKTVAHAYAIGKSVIRLYGFVPAVHRQQYFTG